MRVNGCDLVTAFATIHISEFSHFIIIIIIIMQRLTRHVSVIRMTNRRRFVTTNELHINLRKTYHPVLLYYCPSLLLGHILSWTRLRLSSKHLD